MISFSTKHGYLSGERCGTLSTFFGKMDGSLYELGQLKKKKKN